MDKGWLLSEMQEADATWDHHQHLYRHVLSFPAGRLDAAFIRAAGEAAAAPWLGAFLDASAGLSLESAEYHTDSLFPHWHQEIRNQERRLGYRPLGLAFPLVRFMDEGGDYLSPLLIWSLTLESGPMGGWRLRPPAGRRVRLNYWLMSRLRGRLSPELHDRIAGWERKAPAAGELREGLAALAAELSWSLPEMGEELSPCPAAGGAAAPASAGEVCWSGVVALFPRPDRPDLGGGPADAPQAGESVTVQGHQAGLLDLDPFQATAANDVRHQALTLIDGMAGAGKTHLLVHLLSNALSNGRTAIVVAPTLSGLQEIQDRLAHLRLGTLSFLATEPERDATLLLEFLRAAADAPLVADPHDEERYRQALAKWERDQRKLDERYQALRRPVFGTHNWTDTVGLYLASHRREGKELLAGQLNAQDFRFKYDEYRRFRQIVIESQPLYLRVNTLRHPLQALHPDIFLQRSGPEGKAFVVEQVEVFLRRCDRLHKEFLARINDYTDLLTRYYRQWSDGLRQSADALWEKIEEGREQFGRDFELTSLTSLRLYGAFLAGPRAMLRAKEEIFEQYRQLADAFARETYFDFTFTPFGEGRQLPRLREQLGAFREALSRWQDQIAALVQEEVQRLSQKTAHPRLQYQGHIAVLEESLELQVAELNRAGLFEEVFENRMLTVPKRRRYLEEIIELLENTRLFLRDFEPFHEWRRHWLQLPEPARKVVRALIKVKPADWLAAFDSWYLNQCLAAAYDPALPNRDVSLRQFMFNSDQLRELLVDQIASRWRERRQRAMRELRRQDRKRYQQLLGRRRQDSHSSGEELWAVFREHWREVLDVLPVWLMTPDVAERLALPLHSFDRLLLEDAQAIAAGQAAPALSLSRQRVLFADSQLLALGPGHSLWAAARGQGAPPLRLPFVHRWAPGNPVQLALPERVAAGAIDGFRTRLDGIAGYFDEAREVNEEEARHIIHLLNEVEKTPQRTYPSIAIVACTVAQRDLIAGYLQEIKQRQLPGEEIVQQLERNGLGVFHIDELEGQHPEVVFLSTTYAPVDPDGRLPAGPDRLDLSRLMLLMGRPRKAVFAVHSLPASVLRDWEHDLMRPGTFLLANYLNYIHALQQADFIRQQDVLQRLAAFLRRDQAPEPVTPFIREVTTALEPFVDAARLHPAAADDHLILPLKIDPAAPDSTPLVLTPDGFFAHTPATDFRWEFQQQEHLSGRGYTVEPVWSVDWWKNAQLEARRLAAFIARHDEGGEAAGD